MKHKLFIAILLSFFFILVIGCEKKRDTKDSDEITVVTTYMPATDIVLALGGKDQLVGIDDSSVTSVLLNHLEPKHEIKGIGSKKNGVNIEEIISLNPNVLVLFTSNQTAQIKTQLENVNIEVVVINPESIESLKNDVLKVGQAIGRGNQATHLIEYMDEKVNDVKNRVEAISVRKKVYLAGARGMLSTCSGEFYQHEIITTAGGHNVSGDLLGGWNEITSEQLISWNPDVIINLNYSPDTVQDILEHELFQEITAIKENEVFEIPSTIESWDMPKPSSVLAMMWLGKVLYPTAFYDVDILAEANDFYDTFYGKSFLELGGEIEN